MNNLGFQTQTMVMLAVLAELGVDNRIFSNLSSDLVDALHLHWEKGMSKDEAASALGITTQDIESRLRQSFDILGQRIREAITSSAEKNVDVSEPARYVFEEESR